MDLSAHQKDYPLSSAQTEIWLAQQLNPESAIYNIAQYVEIPGFIDTALFERALSQVLMEAECSRLQFISAENGIRQFVGPLNWSLPVIDVSNDPNPRETAEVWMRANCKQPINLQHGLKVRHTLIKVAEDQYLWYHCAHRILFDGYSAALILQRAAEIYSSFANGTTKAKYLMKPLSSLLRSDIDYRNSTQFTIDQNYWLNHCKNWPEPATLTSKKAVSSHLPVCQSIHFSSQTISSLTSDPHHLKYIWIAVIAAYLHRWTGADEVTLGFPVTAHSGDIRHISGITSNVIPIRIIVKSGMNLSSLTEQVAHEVLCGLKHQRYRSEELRPGKSQRLFGTTINFVPFDHKVCFGKRMSTVHNLLTGPIDDLTITIYNGSKDGPLKIDFAANPALYTANELTLHQNRILSLFDTLTTNPSKPVTDIAIIDPGERRQLIMKWSDTEMRYSEHMCIHQLFEEKVAHTPEAIAVVYADQILSYAELNARANRLAHQLIELGIGTEEPVAICVRRSPEMVIGLLAILKAGGVSVPLDPTLPLERLKCILKDAAPSIMLADEIGRASFGESTLAQLAVLDPSLLLESPTSNPDILGLTSRHLAYVIYTSGSTDTPKGVMLEHRGIVNLIQDQIFCCGVQASSRCLQFATFGFDVSISEIFTALGSGASLYIPSDIVRLNRYELWDFMETHAITHAVLPPALLENGNDLPTLSNPLTLVLISEAPKAALLESLLKHGVVFTAYGTTESSIWSIMWRCSHNISNGIVTMGRPISSTCVYILDPYGYPVPLGAIGELYVGGVGVARGYLNRPEMTAERFSPDPFGTENETRMYKTGDMARYQSNGNIEFLGRNDSQVKIRGHRIELEEIETHLVGHPQVREAAVLALGDEGNKRLVAYVVAVKEERLARILRSYLALKVPEYMLPAAFVRMDALPLTPSGKLNRQAFPSPDIESFAHKTYESPQGEIEIMLAEIWSELLGLERVGRHDNFSELGGHSLLAVRMISHIQAKLGEDVGLRILLETPSLAALAERIQRKHDNQSNQFDVLLPIHPKGNRPPLYCIHPVIGLSWSYFSLSKLLGPEQPIYGLQTRGFIGEEPLAKSIEAMASDYLNQIRSIQPNGPYYLLGWSFGGCIAHCMAILLQQQSETVALLALMDSPIDYTHLEKLPNMEKLITHLNIPGYSANKYGNKRKEVLTKVRSIIENNFKIGLRYFPRAFCGNVLFFRATVAEEESHVLISPDSLKPYITGSIETYEIPCKHLDMHKPTPLAEISRILAMKLAEPALSQSMRAHL